MTIANVKPPVAEKRPRIETWHGFEKRDDYHWLKAENWQEVMHDPSLLPQDIRAVLEGENAYHEAVMADTAGLQETLFAEMKGRIKEDDSSVPGTRRGLCLLFVICHGRAAAALCPQAPGYVGAGTASAGWQ